MLKASHLALIVLLAGACFSPLLAAQDSDIAVVVNARNPATNVSMADLRKLFAGQNHCAHPGMPRTFHPVEVAGIFGNRLQAVLDGAGGAWGSRLRTGCGFLRGHAEGSNRRVSRSRHSDRLTRNQAGHENSQGRWPLSQRPGLSSALAFNPEPARAPNRAARLEFQKRLVPAAPGSQLQSSFPGAGPLRSHRRWPRW